MRCGEDTWQHGMLAKSNASEAGVISVMEHTLAESYLIITPQTR
jgi:hypothetical protein